MAPKELTLYLCGDVMTGRGIDQILAHPSRPRIHEPVARSAMEYVELAERANGKIPAPVDPRYIWGDSLAELERVNPGWRIVNLETGITTSDEWEMKGINYRMHPANIGCLKAAGIHCCVLANNHVLDWGRQGLLDTLTVLRMAGIQTAGAGRNLAEALSPAIANLGAGRIVVFAAGSLDSGIPPDWAATNQQPGVLLLPDLSRKTATSIADRAHLTRQPGDIVVLSIHWGGNWGYRVPSEHIAFAHDLIDAGIDVIHGHSSHHPKAIEVFQGRPILYGCGDLLNDYEGISGYEEYRSRLVLMYFITMDLASRTLARMEMQPLETKRFRLQRPCGQDIDWLQGTLDRESRKLGSRISRTPAGRLLLEWNSRNF